jgi:hypothetical protein
MPLIILIIINLLAVITMYFLNETIAALQRQNSKLVGDLQNLNNEILYLKEQINIPVQGEINPDSLNVLSTDSQLKVVVGALGVLTVVILGLTVLVFLKNDTTVVAELSKNSIKSTGDYVKEVIVPSVELLNKTSESRINANLDNVKKVVTETGTVLTKHISDVNKEGILCVVNTIKPPVAPKVLGKISREILNYIP